MNRLASRFAIATIVTAGLVTVLLPATPSSATVAIMVPGSIMVSHKAPNTGCVLPIPQDNATRDITVDYTLSAPHGTVVLTDFRSHLCDDPRVIASVTDGTLRGSITEPAGLLYALSSSGEAKADVTFL